MENELNELSGSQWLYWTNTIYETNYAPDVTHKLRKLHGAMKPPELMADIIRFFSKQGELILDPFAGVGGTLLGARMVNRKAIGIELNPKWVAIYQTILKNYTIIDGKFVPAIDAKGSDCYLGNLIQGDCLEVMKGLEAESIAAIITDPPYGCHHQVKGFKTETNFNMFNEIDCRDFGNQEDYQQFFTKIKQFGAEAFRILQQKRYLILLIGDRFYQGEYFPLGYKVAEVLQEVGFKWKGIRIWWNKATQRPLRPYAINRCFIPNITHQNIIIMRKEG
ncbi:MAG TPA: DNA methyltransferase [Bacillota bacterium]|nr:DNA methyltransferase [Bacillota bacterium]HOL10181.1 DNA methyltransferase [Bacillota bacterium]HPO97933.1 DNA methyltransferase [Bacillota bacterium]